MYVWTFIRPAEFILYNFRMSMYAPMHLLHSSPEEVPAVAPYTWTDTAAETSPADTLETDDHVSPPKVSMVRPTAEQQTDRLDGYPALTNWIEQLAIDSLSALDVGSRSKPNEGVLLLGRPLSPRSLQKLKEKRQKEARLAKMKMDVLLKVHAEQRKQRSVLWYSFFAAFIFSQMYTLITTFTTQGRVWKRRRGQGRGCRRSTSCRNRMKRWGRRWRSRSNYWRRRDCALKHRRKWIKLSGMSR